MSAHVTYIITRMIPGIRLAPLTTHLPRIKQLQSQNGPILQALSVSVKELEDKVSFRESDYKKFLFKILNLDACSPFEDGQEYVKENKPVDLSTCKRLFNGILQQGLQISSVKLFDTYDQMIEIYNLKDDAQFRQKIRSFLISQGSLKDLDDLYEIMSNMIIALHNFIDTMNDDYFQLNYFIQQILMVYQFILFCILYIAIWIPFQKSIQEELTKAKGILTNFEISYLIENPYIMNFLKKY